MLVNQYVYFALTSSQVSAAEITARLQIEPDEVLIRGSRQADPVLPVAHRWKIVCRKPRLTVDEQIADIVDRLFDHAHRIGELAAELGRIEGMQGFSEMQVVREFQGPDGAAEELATAVEGMVKLSGQHQLLGWHLNTRILDFLRMTLAELSVDEYGY
jgi:hypothetical protein